MSKYLFIILFFSIALSNSMFAQNKDYEILTYEDFIINVLQNHPIAKQADLLTRQASAEMLAARGNLDPMIEANFNQKHLDEKLYYRYADASLRVPTKWGVDFVGEYNRNTGYFINTENKTQINGLWNVGLEANLIQGLLVNERNIALKQATVFQDINKNQQIIVLNKLLSEATKSYLKWQKEFFTIEAINENIELSEQYLQNTKALFFNGEKTRIDTLEAFIILQDRQVLLQESRQMLIKAQQELENFLWFNNEAILLQETTSPSPFDTFIFEEETGIQANFAMENHPEIQEKLAKQSYFELEQRWKREKLKPKLKLKFNPFFSDNNENFIPNYQIDNYKLGVNFSTPLFFRKQKADIQRGQIKLDQIAFEIDNKQNELQNKLDASLENYIQLREQLTIQIGNISGYQQLLEAENAKFAFGESSVFLINKRQEKLLEGEIKLIKLYQKIQETLLSINFLQNRLIVE